MNSAINLQNVSNLAVFTILSLCMITSARTQECNRIQHNNGGMNGQVRKKTTRELATDYTLHVYSTQV